MNATKSTTVGKGRSRRLWAWGFTILGCTLIIVGLALPRLLNGRVAGIDKISREAVSRRNFDDARKLVDQWLKIDPKSAEAHYLMARVELASNNGPKAFSELGKALELGYPVDKLAPYHAILLAKGGKIDEAEPALRKALADSNEPMPEVAEALAQIYLQSFRMPKAAATIARWMKDDPDSPTPYLWQNEIETRSDADHSIIIQNYREALRRDPKLLKARFGLAERLRQAHQLDESAEEFAAYLLAKPDDPEAHLGAGRVALELGKFDEASKNFDRVLELNPKDATALKERGAIDLNKQKHESARDFLLRAIAVDPYDPDSHYNLSQTYQRLGEAEKAKQEAEISKRLRGEHARLADLRSSLVKKPKDLPLRVELSQWLLEHGHDQEGLQWAEQVLKDAPRHEPMVRILIDYYARTNNPGKANYYRLIL